VISEIALIIPKLPNRAPVYLEDSLLRESSLWKTVRCWYIEKTGRLHQRQKEKKSNCVRLLDDQCSQDIVQTASLSACMPVNESVSLVFKKSTCPKIWENFKTLID